ncbi:MAG: ECF-type sigma factor [Planctomycetota bacterium]
MSDEDSVDLLSRWKNGDESAANQLFDRYVDRLIRLARTRLSNRMQRRIEPEDVVQSAYRSFFRKAGENQYTLQQSGDLWKLLATITLFKVRGQVEFHTAKKRGVYAEESTGGNDEVSEYRIRPEAVAEDPTPEDATAVVEQVQSVMQRLDPQQRQILELALQNHDVDHISQEIQRSGRTVRRALQQIRDELESRLLN